MQGQLTPSDFMIQGDLIYVINPTVKGKPGMLLIWAEWCGHCQRFKPAFNDIAQSIGHSFPAVSIEDTQIGKNMKLGKALNFKGYPTIKFFDQYGRIIGDYNGDRSKSAMLAHICDVYHHCVTHH
jgi:thiol-disulfide isomerase/thioredoxin